MSLSSFPEPPAVGYVTVCEMETQLLAFLPIDPRVVKLAEKQSTYPHVHVQKDFRPTISKDGVKSAFLPHKETLWSRALIAWHDGGLFGLLGSLTSNEEGVSWLGLPARIILKTLHWMKSLQGTLYPHLALTTEEMIAQFSTAQDWSEGTIRALAWHPHITKFAVCVWDNSVRIHTAGCEITPVLKYRLQRRVADLAWRPNMASDLAVACESCVLLWHIEPTSLATRPSASCAQVLSQSGHGPVTSIQWSPDGKLLLSASAADTAMIVWDVAMETNIPLRQVGGAGVSLVCWSPDGSKVFSATPSTIFRVWETTKWTLERWNTVSYVRTACWSPDGTVLLFARNNESIIYSLTFQSSAEVLGGSGAALPVLDVSETVFETPAGDVSVGGNIQNMVWDKTGERLGVMFVKKDKIFQTHQLIALFRTRVQPTLEITPCGFIRGELGETPQLLAFQQNFTEGALLAVAWSSGRISYIPLYFIPLHDEESGNSGHLSTIVHPVAKHSQLFSTGFSQSL